MTIMPEGEAIRNAVQWISGMREHNQRKQIKPLINEAVLRFGLSPKEIEFLMEFYYMVKSENMTGNI